VATPIEQNDTRQTKRRIRAFPLKIFKKETLIHLPCLRGVLSETEMTKFAHNVYGRQGIPVVCIVVATGRPDVTVLDCFFRLGYIAPFKKAGIRTPLLDQWLKYFILVNDSTTASGKNMDFFAVPVTVPFYWLFYKFEVKRSSTRIVGQAALAVQSPILSRSANGILPFYGEPLSHKEEIVWLFRIGR
jgi:hypothetical protein